MFLFYNVDFTEVRSETGFFILFLTVFRNNIR